MFPSKGLVGVFDDFVAVDVVAPVKSELGSCELAGLDGVDDGLS